MSNYHGSMPHPDGILAFQIQRRGEIARDGRVATGAGPDGRLARSLADIDRLQRRAEPPRVPFAGKHDGDK